MHTTVNRQILLVSRPQGEVQTDNFRLVETPLAPLAAGQVRVRNHFLSVDPYMRGRMNEGKSYAPPHPLDTVMLGGTVGEVVASENAAFQVGDAVSGFDGWQEFGTSDGGSLKKVDTTAIPLSAYLGVAGMPGVTAWVGLRHIIGAKAGETVVVSAASGAVGSVVGQLAKQSGCRVVGIAGGPEKCRLVTETFGFDACVDYKAGQLEADLAAATPDGIDGYFENVGGVVLDAVLERMNAFGRIAVCGMIAGYDGQPMPLKRPSLILTARLKVQGFIVSEHLDLWPRALEEITGLLAAKRLHYRESVAQGLEKAPEALIGLLKGRNLGKQVVKLI
ncbi:NADP-dependent oxidoreductase [Robbsia sp. Bb-Pol-6]|uniref:NADP-dependent oxidoreductase n=1 Tax=Robbsia betulipollinis TaxID=2981849 RepID=A0ABT3ZHA7_9BURK|nr:NADP-dependent oxidoreductase [Robbsia betulipollinis]MCY0385807.1 NADP-dependent oxidoreductase [Robbsia betulipollinis]